MDYSNITGFDLFGMPFRRTPAAGPAQADRQPVTRPQPKTTAQNQKPDAPAARPQNPAASEMQQPKPEPKPVQQTKPAQQTNHQTKAPENPAPEQKASATKKEAPAPQPVVTAAHPDEPATLKKAADNAAPEQERKTPETAPSAPKAAVAAAPQPDQSVQSKKELVLDMSSDMPAAGKISDKSDREKRKAHEAAEAKRKTEWEEKQRKKKQAEEEAIQKLRDLSDEQAISEAIGRVKTDVERLTRRNMKECVSEHIQELCRKDPAFARKILNPRKSLARCFKNIYRRAKEYVKQEMEDQGIRPSSDGYGCDVPDSIVLHWAEDYFLDQDAPEDREKEETFVSRPYVDTTPKTKKPASRTQKAAKPDKKEKTETSGNGYEQMTLGV